MMSKNIPLDVTENIFSRLPVKSLLRFRSVCNAWCTLIDRPCFADLHFKQQEGNNTAKLALWPSRLDISLLHLRNGKRKVHVKLTPLLDNDTKLKVHQVIGSYNGLLCMSHRKGNNSMTVIDPSTRKYKDIRFELAEYQRCTHFGNKENWWPFQDNIYGLWYDKEEKDYSVIVIEFPFAEVVNVIGYSIGTKSWRRITENIPYRFFDHTSSGVFLNGTLRGIACSKTLYKSLMLAFNCTTNCFYELPLPANIFFGLSLTVIRGQLCVIRNNHQFIQPWVMEDYGMSDSWVKLPRFVITKHENDHGDYALKSYILLSLGVKEEHVREVMKKGHIEDYTEIYACLESLTSVNIDR